MKIRTIFLTIVIIAFMLNAWLAIFILTGTISGLILRYFISGERNINIFKNRIAQPLKIIMQISLVLIIIFLVLFYGIWSLRAPFYHLKTVNHLIEIEISAKSDSCIAKETIFFPLKYLNVNPSDNGFLENNSQNDSTYEKKGFPIIAGWDYEGEIDDNLIYKRISTQVIKRRWIPFRTINEFHFSDIRLILDRNDIYLTPDSDSKIVLNAPEYLIAETFPVAESRQVSLTERIERILIHIPSYMQGGFDVQFEVISPLMSNKMGHSLLLASLFAPIKWTFFALCAIFAEQIKDGILIPFVKRIFKILGLKYRNNIN